MEKKSKHILWLTPGFAADESDDTCIPTLQDLAREYKNHEDFRLTIVSLYYPFEKKEYVYHGTLIKTLGGENPRGLRKLYFLVQARKLLGDFIIKEKVDLIHSFWYQDTTLLGQSLSQKFTIPLVSTFMGQDLFPSKYHRWIRSDKIKTICLCENAQNRFREIHHSPCEVVPFGLPDLKQNQGVSRDIDLLAVGSIIPLKNHLFFIDLISSIITTGKRIKAVLIGEWHDQVELQKIRKKIEKEKLDGHIELIDKLSRAEVFSFYQRSKILVHSAHYEGQGMVMQEALRQGCTVLSFGAGIQLDARGFHLSNKANALEDAIQLLESNTDEPGENVIHISQTYEDYKRIYFSLVNRSNDS